MEHSNEYLVTNCSNWIIIFNGGIDPVYKNFPDNNKTSKSTYLTGILMPILFAFIFGETLIDILPGLTIIDLAAYFFMGVVSGFFLATYFFSRKA